MSIIFLPLINKKHFILKTLAVFVSHMSHELVVPVVFVKYHLVRFFFSKHTLFLSNPEQPYGYIGRKITIMVGARFWS